MLQIMGLAKATLSGQARASAASAAAASKAGNATAAEIGTRVVTVNYSADTGFTAVADAIRQTTKALMSGALLTQR